MIKTIQYFRRVCRVTCSALIVVGIAGGGVARADAPTSTVGQGIYGTVAPPTGSSAVGAVLWSGGTGNVSGATSSPDCPPALNSYIGQSLAKGYQNAVNISNQNHKTPTQILTGCLENILTILDTFNIFSKAGSLGFQAIMSKAEDAILNYAATAVCQAVNQEFNALVNQAFNASAFLTSNIPCGIAIGLPLNNSGTAGLPGVCNMVGGPLINVGAQGGTVVVLGGQALPAALGTQVYVPGGGTYNPLSSQLNSGISSFLSH